LEVILLNQEVIIQEVINQRSQRMVKRAKRRCTIVIYVNQEKNNYKNLLHPLASLQFKLQLKLQFKLKFKLHYNRV
jgi:hypothetical protein